MNRYWLPAVMVLTCVVTLATATPTFASPEKDLKDAQEFFKKKFPKVAFDDFSNGIYALDASLRAQWESIMEFAPYEIELEKGEKLFKTPFKNGKTYSSCFRNGGLAIANEYPYWDSKTSQIKTMPMEVNECRERNGEKPLAYEKGDIAAIVAYMYNSARGKRFSVKVPKEALEAYEKGKQTYYTRRGQLNFACYHCHMDNAGLKVRSNLLGAAIGQASPFPVYRSQWGELGTIDRRYRQCYEQVRAKAPPSQSEELRNLEFFHTHLSNGLPLTAPGARE